MRKIGPLSLDLVVACQILEIQESGSRVEFTKLVNILDGLIGKSTVPGMLRSLADWGIVGTDYGETESGRAGRFYFITNEATPMIREIYESSWEKVLKHRKTKS